MRPLCIAILFSVEDAELGVTLDASHNNIRQHQSFDTIGLTRRMELEWKLDKDGFASRLQSYI